MVALPADGGNALGALAHAAGIQHPAAGHADGVDLFAVKAMLGQQLVEAVGVARLEKNEHPAVPPAGFPDEVLGKVGAAEIVPDKIARQRAGVGKEGRRDIIVKLAALPAEHAVNGAGRQQLAGSGNEGVSAYFLHRRSSNLLFSPRAATVSANSFMVAANLAPSAAETHSTRVRSFSIPR